MRTDPSSWISALKEFYNRHVFSTKTHPEFDLYHIQKNKSSPDIGRSNLTDGYPRHVRFLIGFPGIWYPDQTLYDDATVPVRLAVV